ncbi:MAG TPA: hypothetical protein VF338_07755, partial [Leptolinea sp.]
LETNGVKNVEYHFFPKPSASVSLPELIKSDYAQVSNLLRNDSLDFILVDGIIRPACVLRSSPLLKKGGWLIIDDANHYLPGNSKAPNSRKIKDGPINIDWQEVQKELAGWEETWFGNGIKETVIFHKPESIHIR